MECIDNNIKYFWNVNYINCILAGDTLESQTSKSKLSLFWESFDMLKKFILETIVQVVRSLGTKSLDTNWIF